MDEFQELWGDRAGWIVVDGKTILVSVAEWMLRNKPVPTIVMRTFNEHNCYFIKCGGSVSGSGIFIPTWYDDYAMKTAMRNTLLLLGRDYAAANVAIQRRRALEGTRIPLLGV